MRKEARTASLRNQLRRDYPWSEVATYPLLVWAAHLPLSLFAVAHLPTIFLAPVG